MTQLLPLPRSRDDIAAIQRSRKPVALAQARRARFYAGKLDHIDAAKLDDPAEKDMLRALGDRAFYDGFCLPTSDGIAEYWRSGGATGVPLFYPRSFADIAHAMVGFSRVFACSGCEPGESAHLSFPLGIHPAGQMLARSATQAGIAINWAGSGTSTPTAMQLELIERLRPTIWMGMSSYGLHLANSAEARGIDLAAGSVKTVLCSAEALSDAKREKLARHWGARVLDSFGMTEAGMMGAEDAAGSGFRVWTDMFFIEVIDPETNAPVAAGEIGCLVVTPLWTNNVTPFLRWNSGDLVTYRAGDDGAGPFSVFPLIKHAHRTAGFFKLRGINVNHAEFEDFMFRNPKIGDFKAELLTVRDLETLCVSIEIRRGADAAATATTLVEAVKDRFGLTPGVEIIEPGTLAKEFESTVKAARFVDRRS